MFALLLLLITGNTNYGIGVASCGIRFVPSFLQITQHRFPPTSLPKEHGDLIRLIFLFK